MLTFKGIFNGIGRCPRLPRPFHVAPKLVKNRRHGDGRASEEETASTYARNLNRRSPLARPRAGSTFKPRGPSWGACADPPAREVDPWAAMNRGKSGDALAAPPP